jgi:hypothetical protein
MSARKRVLRHAACRRLLSMTSLFCANKFFDVILSRLAPASRVEGRLTGRGATVQTTLTLSLSFQ